MDLEKAISKGATACVCSSATGIGELAERSRRLSKGSGFVLLLDDNSGLIERLLPAYLNAMLRYVEKNMKAESPRMEMLMLVSKRMNIGIAIKEAGARDSSSFIAFSTDAKVLSSFLKGTKSKIKRKIKLELNLDVSGEVSLVPLVDNY